LGGEVAPGIEKVRSLEKYIGVGNHLIAEHFVVCT